MSDEEEGGSRRAENYSQHEEIQVCRSWMHISQDPIVGAQQKKSKFWERIEDQLTVQPPWRSRTSSSAPDHYLRRNDRGEHGLLLLSRIATHTRLARVI